MRMKRQHWITLATLISLSGVALDYQFAGAWHKKPAQAASAVTTSQPQPAPAVTDATQAMKGQGSRQLLQDLVEQTIADAIAEGRFDISKLSAEQLALLPPSLRVKAAKNDVAVGLKAGSEFYESPTDTPEPPPQKADCPPPGQLPTEWNNDYNKGILRERGCVL